MKYILLSKTNKDLCEKVLTKIGFKFSTREFKKNYYSEDAFVYNSLIASSDAIEYTFDKETPCSNKMFKGLIWEAKLLSPIGTIINYPFKDIYYPIQGKSAVISDNNDRYAVLSFGDNMDIVCHHNYIYLTV